MYTNAENIHYRPIQHVSKYLFEGGFVEGDIENLGYTFDRITMKLYDTDGDEIVYKRSMTF